MPATYADRLNGVETSLAIKAPVRVATTANITLSGLQVIDGVTLVADERVLVKDQTTGSENGIWISSSTAWERAKDFDGNRDVRKGTLVYVTSGTSLGALDGVFYQVTTADPITIGSTTITWEAADVFEMQEFVDLAEEWASKTDGIVDTTDYSAKAWAVGGTGVTDTASRGAAKEWAIETSSTVDTSGYSAKEWATGIQTRGAASGGSSKDWATYTSGTVDNAGYSSKEWATGTQTRGAASGGSAKDWANYTGGTVDDAEYSAKYYAALAQAVLAAGIYDDVQDKSADYTIVAADEGDLFRVDSTGANRIITLTAIATLGDFKCAVVKYTGDANTVTIQGSGGDTINGSASYVLDARYETVTLISSNGSTDWLAVGSGSGGMSIPDPDFFSGNGVTTGFTLSIAPGSENAVAVYVSGIRQTNYSVASTTLTFDAAPPSGTNNIAVFFLGIALDIGTPGDGTVSLAKMANLATQRVIGRNTAGTGTPEAVTLTQLLDWIGSAAQGDILYRGAASWARLGAGTAGQALVTGGAGANPSFRAPKEGYEVINTYTPSGVASLSITGFDSALYRAYRIRIRKLSVATDNVSLYLRTSTNGGSSFDSGASDYAWYCSVGAVNGTNPAANGDNADNQIILAQNVGNGAAEDVNGWIEIPIDPSLAEQPSIFWALGNVNSASNLARQDGYGRRLASADVDAVQLLPSSGNFTAAEIVFEGVRK